MKLTFVLPEALVLVDWGGSILLVIVLVGSVVGGLSGGGHGECGGWRRLWNERESRIERIH